MDTAGPRAADMDALRIVNQENGHAGESLGAFKMMAGPPSSSPVETDERRNGTDRRRRTLHALMHGSFNPRRRAARREGAATLGDVDWHHPKWLAVGTLIVVLSCVDAALTLTLIERGAYEVNPVMGALLGGSALVFTLVKIGLTAGGVVLLTMLARMRAFGKIPVSLMLYLVLLGYGTLVFYEYRLL